MMRKEKAVFFIEEACLTGAKQNKSMYIIGDHRYIQSQNRWLENL